MSRVQTVNVPSITAIPGIPGSPIAPAVLSRSSRGPQRVLVRNTGPVTVVIAMSAQAVSDLSSVQDAYILDPAQSDVFVLEAADSLYVAGIGGGGKLSIHVSPAFPLKGSWGES